jgi:broad specificity phosphatase PhoE
MKSSLPSETRVLLLRHAETAEPDRFHGAESDIGLGDPGRVQAEAVSRRLAAVGLDAVYASGMRRARETAEILARARGLEVRIVEALHERRMGPLSGRPRAEGWATFVEAKQRWRAGELDFTHEGGESYAQIRSRVVPAFQRIAEAHPCGTVAVVAHGVVIRVLLTTLLADIGPEHFDEIAIGYVAVNDLHWDGRCWRARTLSSKFGAV